MIVMFLPVCLFACSFDYSLGGPQPPDVEIVLPDPAFPYRTGHDIVALGRASATGKGAWYEWTLDGGVDPDCPTQVLVHDAFVDTVVLEYRFLAPACGWTLSLTVGNDVGTATDRVPLVVLEDVAPVVQIVTPCDGCERSDGDLYPLLAVLSDDVTPVQRLQARILVDGTLVALVAPDSLGQVYWLLEGVGAASILAVEAEDEVGNTSTAQVTVSTGGDR